MLSTSELIVKPELHQRIASLNPIVLQLTRSATLDELFSRAVELGLQLGFDRLGIMILDDDPGQLRGTYGIDEMGELRDERDHSLAITDIPLLMAYLQQMDQRQAALLGSNTYNMNFEVIGAGWSAVVGLWDGETVVGYLFADNLLNQQPYTEGDGELLSMYASSLGHLSTHLRIEQSLENRRVAASSFLDKMAVLNQLTVQLARCVTLDQLCRDAIHSGRQSLGFDRLGLWFISDESGTLTGSYGTSEDGTIRSEYDRIMRLDREQLFGPRMQNSERYIYDTGIMILDLDNKPIAYGWKAAAALWDGEQIIGYLFTDNLLKRAPYSVHNGELLALYAMLLGHLCSRLWIEESLRAREASYRTLVDAIPDYTFIVTRSGQILDYHEAQPPTLQIPLAHFVGKNVFDVLSEELANRYMVAVEEAFLKQQVTSFEYPLRYGEFKYYLEARLTAGADDKAIVLVRDITDHKLLQEQLYASQKMESLGRMAGGVAHDFNNFLTVIQGFSGLAQNMVTDTSPKLRNALERIEFASAKAAQLTNQLLLFARKQVVKPQYFEVNTIISGIKTILVPLMGEEIDFVVELDPVGGYLYMDPGQLEQVVVNLAVNARDAMNPGGMLTISTQNVVVPAEEPARRTSIPPDSYVVIEVQDTGTGIEESVQQHIFEPFFTTKEQGKGTGLGLAICHSIVQQNGGYIQVDSKVGEGTTFKLYFPQKPHLTSSNNPVQLGQPMPGVGTILLVEDDDSVREVVEEVLSMYGYTVLACASGSTAIDIARDVTVSINLLITDMAMPKMGGREVAEQFLQLYPNTPILLVSGYVDNLPESLVSRSNVRFLPKPYTAITLTEAVQQCIGANHEYMSV